MNIVDAEIWRATDAGQVGYSDALVYGGSVEVNDNTFSPGIGATPRDDGQATLWSYRVPTGFQVECDQLSIAMSIAGLWDVTSSSGNNNYPRAVYQTKVDGTTIHEGQVWARGRYDQQGGITEGAYGLSTIGKISEGTVPFHGDGVALTAGQVFSVTIDPITPPAPLGLLNNGFFAYVVRVTLWGLNAAGRHVTVHGNYRPADLASGQTAFTHTVAVGGLTVLGFAVWADGTFNVVVARATLWLNDHLVQELGFFCGTCLRTAFQPWVIPLGFDMIGGDILELRGNPWLDTGGTVSVMLAGVVSELTGDENAPTIAVISPTPGVAAGQPGGFPVNSTAAKNTPIVVELTDVDPGLQYFVVVARIGSTEEVVYRRGHFRGAYVRESWVETVNDGVRLHVRRDGGWTGESITFAVDALDAGGNIAD